MSSDNQEHRTPWGSPCAQQNKELLNNEEWATLWDSKIPIIETCKISCMKKKKKKESIIEIQMLGS